jgi:DNA-binding XRE family transcriptional regulator
MRPKPRCARCGKNALKRVSGGYVCQKCRAVISDVEPATDIARVARRIRDGRAFALVRRALNMGAVELGELLGVAPETISRWENERAVLPKLAAFALGCLYEYPEATRKRLS